VSPILLLLLLVHLLYTKLTLKQNGSFILHSGFSGNTTEFFRSKQTNFPYRFTAKGLATPPFSLHFHPSSTSERSLLLSTTIQPRIATYSFLSNSPGYPRRNICPVNQVTTGISRKGPRRGKVLGWMPNVIDERSGCGCCFSTYWDEGLS
jgi:hypothetical protein